MILVYLFVLAYLGLGLYFSVMNLERVYKSGRLTKLHKGIAAPWVLMFIVYDFLILNVIIGTVLFVEPPRFDKKEWLFTGRVSRWQKKGGFRGKAARWICANLLDPFDADGKHCS